jgi:hypothetical protein
VCELDDHICLRISHQNHFSFDSVIIDTHIMEILPNELATTVKGNKRRSQIMREPFLLNNVDNFRMNTGMVDTAPFIIWLL